MKPNQKELFAARQKAKQFLEMSEHVSEDDEKYRCILDLIAPLLPQLEKVTTRLRTIGSRIRQRIRKNGAFENEMYTKFLTGSCTIEELLLHITEQFTFDGTRWIVIKGQVFFETDELLCHIPLAQLFDIPSLAELAPALQISTLGVGSVGPETATGLVKGVIYGYSKWGCSYAFSLGYTLLTAWRYKAESGSAAAQASKVKNALSFQQLVHEGRMLEISDDDLKRELHQVIVQASGKTFEVRRNISPVTKMQLAPGLQPAVKILLQGEIHLTSFVADVGVDLQQGVYTTDFCDSLEQRGISFSRYLPLSDTKTKYQVEGDDLKVAWYSHWARGKMWRNEGEEMPSLESFVDLDLSVFIEEYAKIVSERCIFWNPVAKTAAYYVQKYKMFHSGK